MKRAKPTAVRANPATARRGLRRAASPLDTDGDGGLHDISLWISQHPADWSYLVQSVLEYLNESVRSR